MSQMLPVAILAGGLAMRLRPLTERVPKALIPIVGEPFILHQLRLLRSRGIGRVILCVGHLGEQIIGLVRDGHELGLQVSYVFDGPVLLGTAGALLGALPQLGDSFFVLYGDSYLECDYAAVQDAFLAAGKPALMTVYRNRGTGDTSNVEYAGGKILAYDKRNRTPAMEHIDYGLGVFHRSAFDRVPRHDPWDLENLYQELLRRDRMAAYEVTQRFYEVGSPAGIEELEHHLSLLRLRASA